MSAHLKIEPGEITAVRLKDIEPGEIAAARRDEVERPCEACGTLKSTIVDRRWLCVHCAIDYLERLESERPANWELERNRGFGGSDAGVLAGVDPYRDLFDLIMTKRGELGPLPPSDRMMGGTFLQGGILDFYDWRTGRKTRRCWNSTQRHPAIPIMLATPDGLCIGERRGVDAKLTAFDQAPMWTDGPPAHVEAQCQWYMRFFDYPLWDVARWDGSQLHIYTIEADRQTQDGLLYTGQRVWDRFIVRDELPPIGISDGCARYLRERYPKNKNPLRDATGDEDALLRRYADVRERFEAAKAERDRLENQIKLSIGDSDGIASRSLGAKFTWKQTVDTSATDWEGVAKELLNGFDEKYRKAVVEEHTTKEPGVRRIHWSRPKG